MENPIHLQKCQNDISEFIQIIPPCPIKENKRGIIICAGDAHFMPAYLLVENLIRCVNGISIEWYYVGNELLTFEIELIQKNFSKNVELRNCMNYIPSWFPHPIQEKNIKGYMIKPFAMMASKFTDILFLDADNMPATFSFMDLFDLEEYKKYGNIFWKDAKFDSIEVKNRMLPLGTDIFEKLGISNPISSFGYDLTESGQILIHTEKCWKAICLSYYLNYFKNIYYRLFFGDKDLYYVAFQYTHTYFYQNPYYPSLFTTNDSEFMRVNGLIQRHPIRGDPLFIHRTMAKININEYKELTYIYPMKKPIINRPGEILRLYNDMDSNTIFFISLVKCKINNDMLMDLERFFQNNNLNIVIFYDIPMKIDFVKKLVTLSHVEYVQINSTSEERITWIQKYWNQNKPIEDFFVFMDVTYLKGEEKSKENFFFMNVHKIHENELYLSEKEDGSTILFGKDPFSNIEKKYPMIDQFINNYHDSKGMTKEYEVSEIFKYIDDFCKKVLIDLKPHYMKNVQNLLSYYQNIVNKNIKFNNRDFIVDDVLELDVSLVNLKTYLPSNNVYMLNCSVIVFVYLNNYSYAWYHMLEVFSGKEYNDDSIKIFSWLILKNANIEHIREILKRVRDDDATYFTILYKLFMYNILPLPDFQNLLNQRNSSFMKHFSEMLSVSDYYKVLSSLQQILKDNDIPKINYPFYMDYFYYLSFHDNNNRPIREKLCKLYRKMFPKLNYVSPTLEQRRKRVFNHGDKKKIGFISTNFRLHSVGRDRIGVIKNMNRDLFDIVVFHFEDLTEKDFLHKMIRESGLKNITLQGDFFQWIQMIEAENLDMIVYSDLGMQEETFMLAFARIAPIQITTYGHSETSGIDTIDYYMTSELYELKNCSDHYSEKPILQKSLGTFYYNQYYDPILYGRSPEMNQNNPLSVLPANRIYLTYLQYLHKISQKDFELIDMIFTEIKNVSIVFVNGSSNANMEASIRERYKVYEDRLFIMPKLATSFFYELITKSSMIIDSFPHGGCNTSLESFHFHKIVITKPSKYLRGRFTYGFYRKMGIMDAIVNDNHEYIKKIKYFLQNPGKKLEIETAIKNNKHKLFCDFESVYEWNHILYHLT